jgi:RNA polymerase sigma-54 factor
MSFTQELSMVPRFGLEVSPALISFAEMLMLPYPAMLPVIEEELSTNSALERLDNDVECPICRGAWRSRCPVCSVSAPATGAGVNQYAGEFSDITELESDSRALLRAVRLETSADPAIVDYLIESLDQHGLLDRSCEQLAAELGVNESIVSHVLEVIRRTGPPGVGAASISECLLLQLDALRLGDDQAAMARAVITAHLPALAKGYFASIASALGATPAEVRQVLDLIRKRLRPYPAFDGHAAVVRSYVVPDVVVRRHAEIAGEFTVDLVEPALTRLGVRPRARSGEARAQEADARGSVPQARSFLTQLRDRWETLRRVAECAVQRQKDFLVEGPAAFKPLTRAEVAATLDLHESTVSRTVADKYALLPDRTIVPLSTFFGASGGIDAKIRELLESADGRVSDQRLANLMCEAGYPIARRTVAKHRACLGITSTSLR